MKIQSLIICFFILVLNINTCSAQRGNIAYLHDGAFDDVFAGIILASSQPSLKLMFVETNGETTCTKGLYSTLGFLKNLNRLDVNVLCGAKESYTKLEHNIDIKFPKAWRAESDFINATLWGIE